MAMIWVKLCLLALSPPSLTTISTFLSRLPFFRCSRAAASASYSAVSPLAVDSGQGNLQLRHLVRERRVGGKAKRNILVEIDHEHLVLRVAGAGKRQGRGNNISALRSHASTVVDDQADRDRDIFMTEIFDLLKHSVLVNLKVVLAESGNRSAFVVLHGCVQDDHRPHLRQWCSRHPGGSVAKRISEAGRDSAEGGQQAQADIGE